MSVTFGNYPMFSFSPEEFIVEEIELDGTILERGKAIENKAGNGNGKFCHFVLEKRLWNTVQAMGAIARNLRVSHRKFNAAGAKDRNAITVQLCSAYGLTPEQLLSVDVKDIKINGAWLAGNKMELGDLLGNRFTVTLTKENCGKKVTALEVEKNAKKMNFLFPNYFGPQRFGSLRHNSHLVGKLLLQENWKEAVMNFLTYTDKIERDKDSRKARKQLAKDGDFLNALKTFPGHLKFERTVLGHLSQKPNDFVGALRNLPRHTLLIFLHAYQSYLFNECLRQRQENEDFSIRKGDFYCPSEPKFGFPEIEKAKKAEKKMKEGSGFLLLPIIGSDTEVGDVEKEILKKEGIEQSKFKIKGMPELSSKGTLRPAQVPIAQFEAMSEMGENVIRFALPAGSYATVALDHLLAH